MLSLILFGHYCNAEKCNETEDCAEITSCIGHYTELETYALHNKTLMEELTEIFYPTGRAASKFARIHYNFQTSEGMQSAVDNNSNCSRQQDIYIWSETALYLLGPTPMFWFTLFAVNIPQVEVTIELPCLCNDIYNSLLSRFTYMV